MWVVLQVQVVMYISEKHHSRSLATLVKEDHAYSNYVRHSRDRLGQTLSLKRWIPQDEVVVSGDPS